MEIRLEKIEELTDALHPNNIPVGKIVCGKFLKEPTVGKPFCVVLDGERIYRTSIVTEILGNDSFKTNNSIYKLGKNEIRIEEAEENQ